MATAAAAGAEGEAGSVDAPFAPVHAGSALATARGVGGFRGALGACGRGP
jgi:hypothetical protein